MLYSAMVSNNIEDECISVVSELVQRESENPPGNEQACAEYIVDWFSDRDIETRLVEEPYADRPQAVARVGDGSPTVVLNGHIDVVPAGDREQWSYDPYAATVDGEYLYGRGSTDMKAGVAIGMLTTAWVAEQVDSGELSGSVIMQAAIGEETAEPGTKTLLENGYDGDYGVVLEPTGMRTATSEKGLVWYEITVDGEPSHASRPDQGRNAIQDARPVLTALTEYDTDVRDRTDELVGNAYATITKLEAGTKENVVPERATITIDRRMIPAESVEEVDQEIAELLSGVEEEYNIQTEWERTRTYESAAIETDSDLATVFRKHSESIAGVSSDPFGVKASTDVRNFINDVNTEAITWGPGNLSQAHTYNERINTQAVATGYEILCRSVEELLS